MKSGRRARKNQNERNENDKKWMRKDGEEKKGLKIAFVRKGDDDVVVFTQGAFVFRCIFR